MSEAPLPEDPGAAWKPVRRIFEAFHKRVAAKDRNLIRRLERALTERGGAKTGTNGDLPGDR